MSRRGRKRLVVPEAREALNQFKTQLLQEEGIVPDGTKPSKVSYEVAKDMNIPFDQEYNGDLTTKDAGKIGGQIGGRMVKELVRLAQEELVKKGRV